MTEIPGERKAELRRNFHGSKGEHLFPHPEQYKTRRSRWTAWERAYAAHLDRHRELIENPEPQPGDSKLILDLFAHIEHLKKIIEKEKLLITALRQKAARDGEGDDRDVADALREGGVGS